MRGCFSDYKVFSSSLWPSPPAPHRSCRQHVLQCLPFSPFLPPPATRQPVHQLPAHLSGRAASGRRRRPRDRPHRAHPHPSGGSGRSGVGLHLLRPGGRRGAGPRAGGGRGARWRMLWVLGWWGWELGWCSAVQVRERVLWVLFALLLSNASCFRSVVSVVCRYYLPWWGSLGATLRGARWWSTRARCCQRASGQSCRNPPPLGS